MENAQIAEKLREIADILEMLQEKDEQRYRIRAYREAANNIEYMPEDINAMAAQDKLQEIPGVGESIAEKIREMLETGTSGYLEELKAKMPADLTELLRVPGLGRKTALALYNNLGITTIDELEYAAKNHLIRELPRMGPKTESNILRNIEIYKKRGKAEKRILLGRALPLVREITEEMSKCKCVSRMVAVGSLRRRKETVGDIDIIAISDAPEDAMDHFTHITMASQVIAKGTTKSVIVTPAGLQVDLRLLPEENYYSLLQHSTGSKEHNIRLREYALTRGLSLSEYGAHDLNTGKLITFKSEQGLYRALGLQYIPPELRENQGELEAAMKNALPTLIDIHDIKGDLHVHSDWSDGTSTIRELALKARSLAYDYIAITDHSRSLGVANGLDEDEFISQWNDIAEVNRELGKRGPTVLKGVELDIKADGTLDLPDDVLERFDVVVASVHLAMNQDRDTMTERVLRAVRNPNVDILAHPTGRLLERREPINIDLAALFKAAEETGTILEVNGYPDRMDLNGRNCKFAKEMGAKMVLSTDAHNTFSLDLMEYAVFMARRGWLEKKDVTNTQSIDGFLHDIRSAELRKKKMRDRWE